MKYQKSKIKNQNVKTKNFAFYIVIFIFTLYILHLPSPAYADVKIGETFGFGAITSLGQATTQLVTPIFSLAGAAVVIYFLWGAFKYLQAGGNKEETAGAQQMITQAIVGFIILMFAFLILQFLLSSLFKITDFQLFQT